MVKKKKTSKKNTKSNPNFNRNLLIGVAVIILLFIVAFNFAGKSFDEEGLGQAAPNGIEMENMEDECKEDKECKKNLNGKKCIDNKCGCIEDEDCEDLEPKNKYGQCYTKGKRVSPTSSEMKDKNECGCWQAEYFWPLIGLIGYEDVNIRCKYPESANYQAESGELITDDILEEVGWTARICKGEELDCYITASRNGKGYNSGKIILKATKDDKCEGQRGCMNDEKPKKITLYPTRPRRPLLIP
jgi:hypothetical protein